MVGGRWISGDPGGSGDRLARAPVADGDGPVFLELGDELLDVEVAVVRVAEQPEDFHIGEAAVTEPFVEVVDVAA